MSENECFSDTILDEGPLNKLCIHCNLVLMLLLAPLSQPHYIEDCIILKWAVVPTQDESMFPAFCKQHTGAVVVDMDWLRREELVSRLDSSPLYINIIMGL